MTPNPNPSPELRARSFPWRACDRCEQPDQCKADSRTCADQAQFSPQTLSAPGEVERVLVPRIATRAMVDAADACSDPYSAWNAMVEASNAR